jgi:hypothetical protein
MKLPVKRHEVIQPLDESYRLIPLTQGQNAVVDAEDFEWLSTWNWFASWSEQGQTYYALRRDAPKVRGTRGPTISMHRLILGCSSTEECDHRDHDGLNNRRYNLRKCTDRQNSQNRRVRSDNVSGLRGVTWDEAEKRFSARVMVDGKRIRIGRYKTAEAAACAYDEAAKIAHGEFAHLNFPPKQGGA